jgi:hypothetical protein
MRLLAIMLIVMAAPAVAETATATGAVLRMLDKLSGATEDITMANGETLERGPLTIRMDECRYPENDPSSDAFAHLTVADIRAQALAFDGWMIASSPALSAMDHPRYDVWVLSCDVPGLETVAPAETDTGDDE